MTDTPTAPALSETIAVLGEIRDKLSAYPRYVDALLRAETGLSEAEKVIEPFARESYSWLYTIPGNYRPLQTEPGTRIAHPGSESEFTLGDLRAAKDWLAKHGGRP